MINAKYTGDLDDLICMSRQCGITGQWYHSAKYETYELSSAQSRITWNVSASELEVYSRDRHAVGHFCRILAIFEEHKAAGMRLALPKPRRPRILPMPTVHTLGGAYNLHHATQDRRERRGGGTPSLEVPAGGGMPSIRDSRAAFAMIRLVAKPITPAQTKLCEMFSRRLEQAFQAGVDPDAFEEWIGVDALNAWTSAATKLGMAGETENKLHSHDYLSDRAEHQTTTRVVPLFPG